MNNPCFPAKGNRACMTWDADAVGTITDAGPEQSVIKFDGHDKRERCYANGQFAPVKPSATTPR